MPGSQGHIHTPLTLGALEVAILPIHHLPPLPFLQAPFPLPQDHPRGIQLFPLVDPVILCHNHVSRMPTLRFLPPCIPTTCPWHASCESFGSWHGRTRSGDRQEDAEGNEESSQKEAQTPQTWQAFLLHLLLFQQ